MNLNYKSTQPKPSTAQQKNVPAPVASSSQVKPTVQPPTRNVGEKSAPAYRAQPPLNDTWDNVDAPPPPDNFPEDWDTQWQPSFEEATLAARPEPKVDTKPVNAPRLQTEAVQAQIEHEQREQKEAVREAIAVQPLKVETPQALPSIYVPLAKEEKNKDHPPRQISMILRTTGDKDHDRRRIKTIYGTLISFHGRDRFSFQIFENGSGYLIDFPNDTTRVCPEMLERLKKLIGEESWRVEEITFQ